MVGYMHTGNYSLDPFHCPLCTTCLLEVCLVGRPHISCCLHYRAAVFPVWIGLRGRGWPAVSRRAWSKDSPPQACYLLLGFHSQERLSWPQQQRGCRLLMNVCSKVTFPNTERAAFWQPILPPQLCSTLIWPPDNSFIHCVTTVAFVVSVPSAPGSSFVHPPPQGLSF